MPHRSLLGVLVASGVVLGATPARADETPRIFPLAATAPMPADLAGTPSQLTASLAELLDGEVVDASLEELGRKLRCDIEMSSCLDAVARSLMTTQLVYGTLTATPDDTVKVKLVRFDSGKSGSAMVRRGFTLTAQTPKRLGKQLARAAAQMFDRAIPDEPPIEPPIEEPAAPVPVPKTTKPRPPKPVGDDLDDEPPARTGITNPTWGLIGGGAVGTAIGAGLLLAARSLRAEVAAAPRETALDLRHLQAMEQAGVRRMQIGSTLAIAGSAVLAIGVVRAVLQHDSKPRSRERALAVVPLAGGAAVVFSGGL